MQVSATLAVWEVSNHPDNYAPAYDANLNPLRFPTNERDDLMILEPCKKISEYGAVFVV